MVILIGPAQCQADILHGSNEGHRNEWLTARGFHDGPGANASTHRPNVRVHPTRVAQQTGRITGPNRDDLRSMLKVCEAMREHVKELVRVNIETWECGYAEAVS
jgi:hypothetical protein